jgi:hypothetical protein
MTIYNAGIRLVAVGILAVMLKQQDNGKSKAEERARLAELEAQKLRDRLAALGIEP